MVIIECMNDLLTKRLKSLRDKNNLKQSEVAALANIEPNTYGRYERGERVPTTESIIALSKVFNCSTDYLLGNTDKPNESLDLTDDERLFLDVYAKAKASDQEDIKDLLRLIDKKLNKDEE